MNPIEIERQLAVLLNEAETAAATVAEKLAMMDALSTPEFEANYGEAEGAKAAAKYQASARLVARLKLSLGLLHNALVKAQSTATFPRPRTGK